MAKRELGDVVAASMVEIMESAAHQDMFGKTAKKKCCDCEKKCGSKCPCKIKHGCPRACKACEDSYYDEYRNSKEYKDFEKSRDKKAAKKCCECEGECGDDCACEECNDCMNCGDKMMTTASLEGVRALLRLSELQDEQGLTQSALATLRASVIMMAELEKIAGSNADDERESSSTGAGAAGQTARNQPVIAPSDSSATGVGAAGQSQRVQKSDQNDASLHGQLLDEEKLGIDDLEDLEENGWDDPATVALFESDPEMMQLLQEMADRKRIRERPDKPTMISEVTPLPARHDAWMPDAPSVDPASEDALVNEGEEGMAIYVDPDAQPHTPTEYNLPRIRDERVVDDFKLPPPAKMKQWEEAAEYTDRIGEVQKKHPEFHDNMFQARKALEDLDLPFENNLSRDDETVPPTRVSNANKLEQLMSKFAEEVESDEDEDFEDEDDDKIDVDALLGEKGSK